MKGMQGNKRRAKEREREKETRRTQMTHGQTIACSTPAESSQGPMLNMRYILTEFFPIIHHYTVVAIIASPASSRNRE
jgi:hypothetical protein